jgi:hypothetical protein
LRAVLRALLGALKKLRAKFCVIRRFPLDDF